MKEPRKGQDRTAEDPLAPDQPIANDGREFAGTTGWSGDESYPGQAEQDADIAAADEEGDTIPPEPGLSVLETVIDALDRHPELDLADLSAELVEGTVVLRGTAGSAEERDRAGAIAAALPGVTHVENLIRAG